MKTAILLIALLALGSAATMRKSNCNGNKNGANIGAHNGNSNGLNLGSDNGN